MSLLKHKGLSGAAIEVVGDRVRKWTAGREASPLLHHALVLQRACSDELLPILSTEVLMWESDPDSCLFEMPIYEDTAFTRFDLSIQTQIRLSLKNRLSFAYKRNDFASRIAQAVHSFCSSNLKQEFLADFDIEPSTYPAGYCHGDFGFANMMIDNGQVKMIDFTPSFLYTPLIDIASMEMSLFSDATTTKHAEFVEEILEEFKEWRPQINILRKVKVLSFNNPDIHRDLFNGFFN